MTSITITIDDELADAVREQAAKQGGRSVSSLIREAVTEKLERERNPQPEEVAA